jgi:DNA segregation ATPase FtsK/SpoIIIE, S-DNA-T family
MSPNDRLQYHLEIQARQIEEVFTRYQVDAYVAGGDVDTQAIRFELQAQLQTGWERLQSLKRDLTQALGVSKLWLEPQLDGWRLTVTRDNDHPVDLLELLAANNDLPRLTAVLGIAESGQPVLINLAEPEMSHILVTGRADAGKSCLLRSTAVCLALNHRQANLQLLVIDPDEAITGQALRPLLAPLNYLPHMLAPVVERHEDIVTSLHYLLDEIAYREEQRSRTPTILVLIDNLHHLLAHSGQSVLLPLTRIIQHGDQAGVHLMLSYREGSGSAVPSMLRSHFAVRLVGWVDNAHQARVATGLVDSQADYLLGRGDFLAVSRGEKIHFQAAYINNYDLHHTIDSLYRHASPRLVAQPATVRPNLETEGETDPIQQSQRENSEGHYVNGR